MNSLEPHIFTLRLNCALTTEEIQKLTELGGVLKYDNGLMAIIHILPEKLDEFVNPIESITEVN
jgi:hypothetical protein